MKRLYLLRHSKAGHAGKKILDDQDRPVTDKGIELCIHIAEQIKKIDPFPQLILCSPALRAKQTSDLLLRQMEKKVRVQMESGLYLAEPEDLFEILRETDDAISSLMVIGHNPGLQEFAILLSGKGNKKKFRQMRNNFPPPSMATLDIHINEWAEMEERCGELLDFIVGKAISTAKRKAA